MSACPVHVDRLPTALMLGLASAGAFVACLVDVDESKLDAIDSGSTAPSATSTSTPPMDGGGADTSDAPLDTARFCDGVDAKVCEDFDRGISPFWTRNITEATLGLSTEAAHSRPNALRVFLDDGAGGRFSRGYLSTSSNRAANDTVTLDLWLRVEIAPPATNFVGIAFVTFQDLTRAMVGVSGNRLLVRTVDALDASATPNVDLGAVTLGDWVHVRTVHDFGRGRLTAFVGENKIATDVVGLRHDDLLFVVAVGAAEELPEGSARVLVDDVVVAIEPR